METYQIWEDQSEEGWDCITLSSKEHCESNPEMLGLNSIIIMEFQAESDEAAIQVQYDHYGWGTYKPFDYEVSDET